MFLIGVKGMKHYVNPYLLHSVLSFNKILIAPHGVFYISSRYFEWGWQRYAVYRYTYSVI